MHPRIKSEFWIKAHISLCHGEGAFAVVARRGHEDAGVIALKIYLGAGMARLIMQGRDLDGNLIWRDVFAGEQSEMTVDERLSCEVAIDFDLWILEIEGCDGYGFVQIAMEREDGL